MTRQPRRGLSDTRAHKAVNRTARIVTGKGWDTQEPAPIEIVGEAKPVAESASLAEKFCADPNALAFEAPYEAEPLTITNYANALMFDDGSLAGFRNGTWEPIDRAQAAKLTKKTPQLRYRVQPNDIVMEALILPPFDKMKPSDRTEGKLLLQKATAITLHQQAPLEPKPLQCLASEAFGLSKTPAGQPALLNESLTLLRRFWLTPRKT